MAVALAFSPPVATDDELLASLAGGDRRALDELFKRYRLLAYRVAHRLLGNEADALDAVQDGFIKALTHLSGFQGRSTFKTWLLRVVSNAALDLGRQRGRREMLTLEGATAGEGEQANLLTLENASAGLEREDLRQALNRALALLPEAQR